MAGPVRGSLIQPSFICYEIKHDSSWGKPWAGADSWETDPLKGKWGSKSEWGGRKVAKELPTRNRQKERKCRKKEFKDRQTFPKEKSPSGKNTKRPETSFSDFQYFKGEQLGHIPNQNKSTIILRLRFVNPSKRSRRSASSLLSFHGCQHCKSLFSIQAVRSG